MAVEENTAIECDILVVGPASSGKKYIVQRQSPDADVSTLDQLPV
jgi:hypothetical protein